MKDKTTKTPEITNIPFKKLGIAVSGGSDSVALFRLIISTCNPKKVQLAVFHVNHGIRLESDDDERWVENLASRFAVPFFSRKLSIQDKQSVSKIGLEASLRMARLVAFSEMVAESGVEAICTGHQADDQAETFLIRLMRGTSLSGLLGIRHISKIRIGNKLLKFWRPLLNFSKKTLIEYLEEIGQDWREDSTNLEPIFFRNRIRHEILPLLTKIRPDFVKRVAKLIDNLRPIHRFLFNFARKKLLNKSSDNEFPIYERLPEAVQKEMLRQWYFSHLKLDPCCFNENLISRMFDLVVTKKSGRKLIIGDNEIIRESTCLRVIPRNFDESQTEIQNSAKLILNSSVEFHGRLFELCESPKDNKFDGVWVNKNIINDLEVRFPRPGDYFRPAGCKGGKKLAKWLIDKKIPKYKRKNIIVIAYRHNIVWIPDFARSCETSTVKLPDTVFLQMIKLNSNET